MSTLARLGTTQQRLLRQLLMAPEGCSVEQLCERLHISHNAVRQHLGALLARDYIERGQARPSGGRPLARFRLTEAGRALFPRNYGLLGSALLSQLRERYGSAELEELLRQLGAELGRQEVAPSPQAPADEVARWLAERLDQLGYEAVAARHGPEQQVEAFNCVFHALARSVPQVCRFDLAYMEAASGRRIHHMECIVRGGHVCRFRIGTPLGAPHED
ncbi:MAG TPA: MarR family transcriptional regulator [Frateuria sp.]|uniref:helix-turn-helix transcriptional regulator n=1 Tax=Frateuria sp. TaxID=2211372 RepID=UPI002D7FA123|nr:MarR family transcriptional regulator [Frateuria sp.]HET6804765.1 MarR family transcriptional regulator [Frateuria sp.]